MLQKAYLPQLRPGNLWTSHSGMFLIIFFISSFYSLNAQVIIEVDDINLFSPQLTMEKRRARQCLSIYDTDFSKSCTGSYAHLF